MNKRKLSVIRLEKKKFINYFIGYLFLFPALILFFLFFYLPSFSGIYYSFTQYDILTPAIWVGFDNYIRAFQDPVFLKGLINSLKYFILMVPSLVVFPLLLAVLVNQKLKGIQFFRLIYFLPVITPTIAVAIVWKFIYNLSGPLNSVLKYIGINEPVDWLYNLTTALPAISMVEVWKTAGYFMMIYLAGLQSVQQSLIEAAKLDGANPLRILWHVYIPQLRPFITITIILATLGSVRTFTSVFIMTEGGPLSSTITLPLYIYNKAFVSTEMGYASAMGVVLWIILMVLTLINLKVSTGGDSK